MSVGEGPSCEEQSPWPPCHLEGQQATFKPKQIDSFVSAKPPPAELRCLIVSCKLRGPKIRESPFVSSAPSNWALPKYGGNMNFMLSGNDKIRPICAPKCLVGRGEGGQQPFG